MTTKNVVFDNVGDKLVWVTLTYSYMPYKNVKKQFSSTVNEVIANFSKCGNALIVPEYTMANCLHWHGILEIKDMVYYRKHFVRWTKRHGFSMLKEVNNYDKLVGYMEKDISTNMIILEQKLPLEVKYDHFYTILFPREVEEDCRVEGKQDVGSPRTQIN